MPQTSNKLYEVQTTGSNAGTWGDVLNNSAISIIDRNIGGTLVKNLSSSNVTLTAQEAQNAILRLTGTLLANVQITSSNIGFYFVENATSGNFSVTLTNGVGSPVTIFQNRRVLVFADPTNGIRVLNTQDPIVNVLTFVKDNNGTVLPTGVLGEKPVPFDAIITKWVLLSDQTGSAVVDIWKDTEANYPPTAADSITGSSKPTLTSAQHASSTVLTGWNTQIFNGDILRFNLDSVSNISRLTIALSLIRFTNP